MGGWDSDYTQQQKQMTQTTAENEYFTPSFSIRKLAKTPLGNHLDLPDSPGIYFALDAAYRVWYVGISGSSLRTRHASHNKLSEFQENNVLYIAYLAWTDLADLEEWEAGYIQKFNPPLNSQHAPKELPHVDLGYGEEHYISRYREIRMQINLLNEELEELKPNLVTMLEREGGKISDSNTGYIGYLTTTKTYRYSSTVETINRLLKETKEQEEKDGIATIKSVSTYPVFKFK